MLKRLVIILTILSLAGLLISCGDNWLTGGWGDSDEEPDQTEEEN